MMILLAAIAAGASDPNTFTTSHLIFVGGIILTALLGWVGTVIAKRLREPTRIETLWPRLDNQDTKIDAQGTEIEAMRATASKAVRRADAAVGVVRDLVRQWPHGHIPRLNPVDLDELDEEDAIPAEWRVKP